jgi:hypothetical protein
MNTVIIFSGSIKYWKIFAERMVTSLEGLSSMELVNLSG